MNAEMLKKSRYLVVVGALLIQLALGAIYAWSVFTPYLKKAVDATYGSENQFTGFGFNAAQTQWIFAVGLATFAVVMVLAGKLQAAKGPRLTAALGGLLLGLGYVVAGVIGTSFITQLIFIGFVGGAGIGLAYVCPIAVGMKWFPDRKGLITGLAVAGFGFGALGWVKIAGDWGHLIENMGVLPVFLIYGIAFFVMVELGALVMVNPPEGWKPEGWSPPPPKAGEKHSKGSLDFLPNEMLKKPQFYGLWAMFIFSAGAGLMTIGIIKLFGIDALQERSGLSVDEASAAAGTAMAVFFSLANGLGRIIWGTLSDFLTPKLSLIIMTFLQGVMMFVTFFLGGTEVMLYACAAIVGFNFGGNFSLFPLGTAEFFGTKNVGRNYGWMFTAYGVGGIFGPVMAGMFKDAGAGKGVDAWMMPFVITGVLCVVAAVIGLMLRQPEKDEPAPAA